jgi:predicted HicB family RNase H-like nuclease
MKFIIEGKTYNTGTAILAARYSFEDDKGNEVDAEVYRTRPGDFFISYTSSTQIGRKCSAESISYEELQRVLKRQNMEIVDADALETPDEEDCEEVTIYLRVPRRLKDRIVAAAGDQSVNAWATKALVAAASSVAADTGASEKPATSDFADPASAVGYPAARERLQRLKV